MADQPIADANQPAPSTGTTDVNTPAAAPSAPASPTSDPSYLSGLQAAINGAQGTEPPSNGAEARTVPTEDTPAEGQQPVEPPKPETPDGEPKEGEPTDPNKPAEENKGPVPYERFSEVVEEKNSALQQMEEFKPYVEAYRGIETYLTQNNISNEEFQWAMSLAAAKKNSPDTYLKMLQPDIEQVGKMKGNVLDADLQAAVENAEMSQQWAEKLQATRAKESFQQRNMQAQQQAQQRQQQEAFRHSIVQATMDWAKATQAKDTEFQPSKNGAIGFHEVFCSQLQMLASQHPPQSPEQAKTLCEQVYAKVKPLFKSQAKPNGVHVRTSQVTPVTTPSREPKTHQEAIQAGIAAHNRMVLGGRQ